jgi:hypothetical protein
MASQTGQARIIQLFNENYDGVELQEKYRKFYQMYMEHEGETVLRNRLQVVKDVITSGPRMTKPKIKKYVQFTLEQYDVVVVQHCNEQEREEHILYNKGLVVMAAYELINDYI